MNVKNVAALGMGLQLAAVGTAFAANTGTGMMHGVTHGPGAKARCSPGDPNVLVDQKAKTYVLDKAAMKMAKGSAKASVGAAAGGAAGADAAAMDSAGASGKSTVVSMCKSEAASMGAKMSGGGMAKTKM